MRFLTITALLLLLVSPAAFSQTGYLFVKKGIKKKRTYYEGDPIHFLLNNGHHLTGIITLLRNDTIFVDGFPLHKTAVKQVILEKKPKIPFPDAKTLGLIAAGSALTSLGLSLNNRTNRDEALIAGPVIGFGPLLAQQGAARGMRALKRKKYRIGKKFYLQMIDFHISRPIKLRSF